MSLMLEEISLRQEKRKQRRAAGLWPQKDLKTEAADSSAPSRTEQERSRYEHNDSNGNPIFECQTEEADFSAPLHIKAEETDLIAPSHIPGECSHDGHHDSNEAYFLDVAFEQSNLKAIRRQLWG